jgi:hypothetical protein
MIGDASDGTGEGELSQRELGTRVHASLETGDYDGLYQLELEAGEDRFQAERVISWAEQSGFMNRQLGKFEKAWSELAFEIPVAGEVLVGSMDRVLKHDEASLTVVDFKVTRHEKSAHELLDAYRTQMELYRWALSTLTGAQKIDAVLVNFSDQGVEEVRVLPNTGAVPDAVEVNPVSPERLAKLATQIIQGREALPTPGALCGVCQFRSICSAAQRYK